MSNKRNINNTYVESTPELWKAVGNQYIKTYSNRRWNAMFCLCLDCCVKLGEMIFPLLPVFDLTIANVLWCLYFLKCYPTEDASVAFSKADPKTWRKKKKIVLSMLYLHLPDININERLEHADSNKTGAFLSVDCTCCPILQPSVSQERYYCGKCKSHNLKYEVGLDVLSAKICWCRGPAPASYHDLNVARSDLLDQLLPGEKVWADKGYRGESVFLVPFPHPPADNHQSEWNLVHSKMHFTRIERVNGRLKRWSILRSPYRGQSFDDHAMIFIVIAKLYNLELDRHPLDNPGTERSSEGLHES